MGFKSINVELTQEHFERSIKGSPREAIKELIWNACDAIIPTFQKLSSIIGKERIVWRYDPILLNEKYTVDYHIKYFSMLADKLAYYTEKCTVSFLDMYKNTQRNIQPLGIIVPSQNQQIEMLIKLNEIAKQYGIYIDTCAESLTLEIAGIRHASCVDKCRFERIGNYTIDVEKDKNQRLECGCVASIDIGAYNTCKNGCLYCYANYSQKTVAKNHQEHDPSSPLLFGTVGPADIVKTRDVKSCKNCQLSLFE